MGFNSPIGRDETTLAPMKAEIAVKRPTRAKSLILNLIFLAYCQAAKEVPLRAAILLVPNIVSVGVCGIAIRKAGNCIKPPPPTTASRNPAISAMNAKKRKFRKVKSPR